MLFKNFWIAVDKLLFSEYDGFLLLKLAERIFVKAVTSTTLKLSHLSSFSSNVWIPVLLAPQCNDCIIYRLGRDYCIIFSPGRK